MKTMVGLIALFIATANAAADGPVWATVPIPGGVSGLARAAGLGAGTEEWSVLYETSRRLHPTYGDPSEAARLRREVRAQLQNAAPRLARAQEPAAKVGPVPVADGPTAPLPLPPQIWRRAILGQPVSDDRLVEAILDEREASLMYRGLFQMDDQSLRFLAQRPDLLKWIREKRADVFSLFAGSVRIRDGRALVPGGSEAEPLWADLLDEPPASGETFLRKLLTRDEGHALFLWDTLDRLGPEAQRFTLGRGRENRREVQEIFRRLASAFARGPAFWRPEVGAFARPLVDPATVLAELRVGSDGRPAPPASRAFWEAAFAGEVPVEADGLLSGPDIDAAWLAQNVGLAPTPEKRRERLTAVAFAQRVFGAIRPAEVSDVLLTLRALARHPALVLVLDRMDLGSPATYAQAAARAGEIDSLGAGPRAATALAQFQGALALLDRTRFVRTVNVAEAEALVLSLAQVPVRSGGYQGGIARWIEDHLLPALAPLVDPDPSTASGEETLRGALAGDRPGDAAGPPVEWEGLWYRAVPGVGERRRLAAIREKLGGNRVDAVLAFARDARLFRDHPGPEGLARLRESVRRVDASALSPDEQRDLKAIASGAPHRTDGLVQAADALLGQTLTAFAYAPHLGSAQGPAVAGASVAARHEFGRTAWDLPEEVLGTGTPWHVRGSLLGLDLALARLSLRRANADMPTHPPGLDPRSALAFARTVVRSPLALLDEEARAIAQAIARGRERAAAARGEETARALAGEAGLDAWRVQGLRSSLGADPAVLSRFFTLAELHRLGQHSRPPSDSWGTPDLVRGGSLHFRWPSRIGYDDIAGQRLDDLQASRIPDLVLRVATELDARGLPARLVPGVMSLFVQDFVQDAAPIAHDDGRALARYARDAPGERFDEYVSALAGDGPLVPAPDPAEAQQP